MTRRFPSNFRSNETFYIPTVFLNLVISSEMSSELKHRRVPKDEVPDGTQKVRSKSQTYPFNNKLKIYFLIALVFTALLLGIHLNIFPWTGRNHGSNILDDISISIGLKKCIYCVIIDAGSTGSRVLTYSFTESFGEKNLRLYKEYFLEVGPGLSSFANNPTESSKGLETLISEAKKRVPKESWSNTAVVLKATAGLRLLPKEKAEALLMNANKVLKSSGFYVTDSSVSILDGVDEGIMSWFTVNFLLDRLGGDLSLTVAALDLGGGSTQISYVPTSLLTKSDEKYLQKVAAFHRNLNVYTHSYLGLGLNEARFKALQIGSKNTTFKSECINPLVKTKWKHHNIEYTIQGPDEPQYSRSEEQGEVFMTPIVGYKKCEDIVKQVVAGVTKPPGLNDREIYAFSYYYDRAAESGLIDFKKGGIVTLRDFISISKAKCHEANVDQPFMCLDLIYITVLLRDGFGLYPSTKINLYNKIDGHEVSWALGAAFHTLQNGV